MANSTVTIAVEDGTLPAQWYPPKLPDAPTLVVCQEIFGVTDYIRRRCQDLNDLGYGVLAPEFYWRVADDGPVPEITETGEDALQQAMALAGRLDFTAATSDGVAAVEWAQDSAPAVGLIGFCFGGGLAFAIAAQTDPAVLVSYYGSALPSLFDLAPQVTAPSLHHFGEVDSFIDADAQAAIREAVSAHGAVWQSHPGADHAFDNDAAGWFHPESSANAWQATIAFLATHLPVGGND
ncbi:dienelactone hydrolase family protein [Naumannella halotolerans]|uniref:Carboxymethylenebutenolidase n=1 Tax=Naumannella halotolerans TaxID=993414 RepID=A0A4R7J8N0_9ACTN|nr:dienelactone hydrolase family protein [Naumannella halotolerans]TDT33861.1 carboxymethylenebutenolidase [Naumannella halotolerans]